MIQIPRVQDARISSFRLDYRGEVRRSIEATWPIDGQPDGDDGHYLVLDATHDRERKRFNATVYTHELTEGGSCVRRRFSYGDQSMIRVGSLNVARYSAKALSNFFDAMFASSELEDAMRRVLESHTVAA